MERKLKRIVLHMPEASRAEKQHLITAALEQEQSKTQ